MRIITGSAKGTKLKAPKGYSIRPTSDRVKESVFNIIGQFVEGVVVLDLFAGTGNLGLEALSRGAARAIFVDRSLEAISLIKRNAEQTRLADRVEIVRDDVLRTVSRFAAEKRQFGLIFCDPPYNSGQAGLIVTQVHEAGILSPNGLLVLEYSRHEVLPSGFWAIRTERYGETMISFFSASQTRQEV